MLRACFIFYLHFLFSVLIVEVFYLLFPIQNFENRKQDSMFKEKEKQIFSSENKETFIISICSSSLCHLFLLAVTGKLWPKLYEIKVVPMKKPIEKGIIEQLCLRMPFKFL